MTVFKSSKNYLTVSVLWLIVLLLLITPFIPNNEEYFGIVGIIGIVILYFISILLAWVLTDTKYSIKQDELFYNSGPIRGSIKIENIRKIERWNKWYVMSFLKPALGNDGLIIYYEKFDDIYISPKNKEEFIKVLFEINPDIEIV